MGINLLTTTGDYILEMCRYFLFLSSVFSIKKSKAVRRKRSFSAHIFGTEEVARSERVKRK